jgi:hypothetical protein
LNGVISFSQQYGRVIVIDKELGSVIAKIMPLLPQKP